MNNKTIFVFIGLNIALLIIIKNYLNDYAHRRAHGPRAPNFHNKLSLEIFLSNQARPHQSLGFLKVSQNN